MSNETKYPILTYMLRMGLIKPKISNEIRTAFDEIDRLREENTQLKIELQECWDE